MPKRRLQRLHSNLVLSAPEVARTGLDLPRLPDTARLNKLLPRSLTAFAVKVKPMATDISDPYEFLEWDSSRQLPDNGKLTGTPAPDLKPNSSIELLIALLAEPQIHEAEMWATRVQKTNT